MLASDLPMVWLGQSVRTTLVVTRYPSLASAPFIASLGDAIHRPALLERIFATGLRARLGTSGPLMLDSGGFTLMSRGTGRLTIDTVADIYARSDADLVIGLDEPPLESDGASVRARKNDATVRNLAILAEAMPAAKLVPVVHGPDLKGLESNARRLREIISRPVLVALGGLVPTLRYSGGSAARAAAAATHIRDAVSIVRDNYPSSRLHVLGAGAPRTMLASFACGADSTDSVSWRRAAGFGAIFLPGTGERFVGDRARRRPKSRNQLSDKDREFLARCDCPACGPLRSLEQRLGVLASHYMPRAAHNAWILLTEAERFVRARAQSLDRAFLESRLPSSWLEAV